MEIQKSNGHIAFSGGFEYFEYKERIYRSPTIEPIEPAYGTRRIYGPTHGRAVYLCDAWKIDNVKRMLGVDDISPTSRLPDPCGGTRCDECTVGGCPGDSAKQ